MIYGSDVAVIAHTKKWIYVRFLIRLNLFQGKYCNLLNTKFVKRCMHLSNSFIIFRTTLEVSICLSTPEKLVISYLQPNKMKNNPEGRRHDPTTRQDIVRKIHKNTWMTAPTVVTPSGIDTTKPKTKVVKYRNPCTTSCISNMNGMLTATGRSFAVFLRWE